MNEGELTVAEKIERYKKGELKPRELPQKKIKRNCLNCSKTEIIRIEDNECYCNELRNDIKIGGSGFCSHWEKAKKKPQVIHKAEQIIEKKVEDYNSVDKWQLSKEVLSLLLDKKRGQATEILVKELLGREYIYTIRDDEKSEMWIYHEGIYIPQAKTFIREFCREILGDSYSTGLSNLVIDKIETDTYIDTNNFFKNNNPEEIAVKNGILNIRTRELREFNPKNIFFNKIPVIYDKKRKCKKIIKHLTNVLKCKEDLPLIQELFGYLLLKEYRFEKAFMFLGTGRNGKGKTIELMKRFIGVENCANIPLIQLETDPFAMGELFNKMANLAGDISSSALKDTGYFKGLTGRDLNSAPRKFLPRVNFVNYAKMIFCANELPFTYDITTAFWNRWILIDFPYTFLTDKEIGLLSAENRQNIKKADPNIIEKLTKDDEMSGLLNWSLDGLKVLFKNNEFSYSKTTEDVQNIWIRKSNSFLAFATEYLQEDYDCKIIKSDLLKVYTNYCKKHKLKVLSTKVIKTTLETNFGVSDNRVTRELERVNCWDGIAFKSGKGVKDGYGFCIYSEKVILV